MRNINRFWRVSTALSVTIWLVLNPVMAVAAPALASPAGLSLLEIKITGDEYVLLQNNGTNPIPDLSVYWLYAYNNVNPLASGVSNSAQQLPAASLLAHQTLLLSASPMATCGASVAGKLLVGLTDGGGFLQLAKVGLNADGSIGQTAGDFVNWSSGANGTIQNVPSSTKSPRGAFYRYIQGNSYAWQPADLDSTDSCQLNIVVAGGSGSSSAVTPLTLAATSPPATIQGITGNSTAPTSVPATDTGLAAPQLSELLPNPNGTGNDDEAEFIELYNPNDQPFDLSGFIIQTGITSVHSYAIPVGTSMPAKSFKAFYASQTKISLSNTTSQVILFDPTGRLLAQSDAYKTAKDGIAWANANGKWQWTSQPTPNAANIIKVPTTTTKSKTSKTFTKQIAPKGLATRKTSAAGATSRFQDEVTSSTVHSWVLALIAGLALLYGAYEYRRDLANRLFQLRAKFSSSHTLRGKTDGRNGD